jgi:hypothetical protein
VTLEGTTPRDDPAVALAAKLSDFATKLPPKEHHILQAMLVMAMDPLDRQARRLTSVLSDDETMKAAALRRDE